RWFDARIPELADGERRARHAVVDIQLATACFGVDQTDFVPIADQPVGDQQGGHGLTAARGCGKTNPCPYFLARGAPNFDSHRSNLPCFDIQLAFVRPDDRAAWHGVSRFDGLFDCLAIDHRVRLAHVAIRHELWLI